MREITEANKPSMTEQRHEIIMHPKKFIRYKQGVELYGMCQTKFEQMAHDANAVYKLDKMVLVNLELFDKYLETFRVIQDRYYQWLRKSLNSN